MVLENLKVNRPLKDVSLNVRIYPQLSVWIKENNLSPTRIFENACVELGYPGKLKGK